MPTGIYIRKPRSEEHRKNLSLANTGKHHSEETKQKIREKRAKQTFSKETREKLRLAVKGEKNYFFGKKYVGGENMKWLGDDVGYCALHDWIRRQLGTPDTCEYCGRAGLTKHQIHWANRSGKYLRDVDDWIRLCAKCHKKYDKENGIKRKIYDNA